MTALTDNLKQSLTRMFDSAPNADCLPVMSVEQVPMIENYIAKVNDALVPMGKSEESKNRYKAKVMEMTVALNDFAKNGESRIAYRTKIFANFFAKYPIWVFERACDSYMMTPNNGRVKGFPEPHQIKHFIEQDSKYKLMNRRLYLAKKARELALERENEKNDYTPTDEDFDALKGAIGGVTKREKDLRVPTEKEIEELS